MKNVAQLLGHPEILDDEDEDDEKKDKKDAPYPPPVPPLPQVKQNAKKASAWSRCVFGCCQGDTEDCITSAAEFPLHWERPGYNKMLIVD